MARKERKGNIPYHIQNNDDAEVFFSVLQDCFHPYNQMQLLSADSVATIALKIIEIIKQYHIVDVWQANHPNANMMRNAIDDYFFDTLANEQNITVPVELMDVLEYRLMKLARARFPD